MQKQVLKDQAHCINMLIPCCQMGSSPAVREPALSACCKVACFWLEGRSAANSHTQPTRLIYCSVPLNVGAFRGAFQVWRLVLDMDLLYEAVYMEQRACRELNIGGSQGEPSGFTRSCSW